MGPPSAIIDSEMVQSRTGGSRPTKKEGNRVLVRVRHGIGYPIMRVIIMMRLSIVVHEDGPVSGQCSLCLSESSVSGQ